MLRAFRLSLTTAFFLLAAASANAGTVKRLPLSALDLTKMQQGWGTPQVNRSVQKKKLTISGKEFKEGVGTHAPSVLYVRLDGKATRFSAFVGVDGETGRRGSVRFKIYGDGRRLFESGVMKGGTPPRKVSVGLKGIKNLVLIVTEAGDGETYDHADWADAWFVVSGGKPKTVFGPEEKAVILTPKPPATPRINGARIFGVRPGSPVLYTIAATGKRPMRFSAENMPPGLYVDSRTGKITGRLEKRGTYRITLVARNDLGEARRELRIVVGDKIALTPPMGWNSWNCWGDRIDAERIRQAAVHLVRSGLAAHGFHRRTNGLAQTQTRTDSSD